MDMSGHEFGIVEKITLNVIRTGSDRINFKILEMVDKGTDKDGGTKIEDIMKETGLTKVPVYKRVNELEKVDLVRRWRGTGIVVLTELGKIFMGVIYKGEDIVGDRLMEMLDSMSVNNKY